MIIVEKILKLLIVTFNYVSQMLPVQDQMTQHMPVFTIQALMETFTQLIQQNQTLLIVTITNQNLVIIMMLSQVIWPFYTTWSYSLMEKTEFSMVKLQSSMENQKLPYSQELPKMIVYQKRILVQNIQNFLLWINGIPVNQLESSLMILMQMVINQLSMLLPTMVETVMNVSVIYQIINTQQQVDIVILVISFVILMPLVKLSLRIVELFTNIPTIT